MSVKQDGEQQGIHSVEHLLAVEVIGQNRPDRARVIEAILQRNDGWRRAERDDLVGRLGETVPLDRVLEHVDFLLVDDPETAAERLRGQEGVSASPIHYLGFSWHSPMSGLRPEKIDPTAFAEVAAGGDRIIAMVDTGVVETANLPSWMSSSIIRGQEDVEALGPDDLGSHGTFVAGLLRQIAPTHTVSMARAAGTDDDEKRGKAHPEPDPTTEVHVADAVYRLIERHRGGDRAVDALNLSLGGPAVAKTVMVTVRSALARWREAFPKAPIFAAAGNSDRIGAIFPAHFRFVRGVSAAANNGGPVVWNGSDQPVAASPRPWVDDLAPGVDIIGLGGRSAEHTVVWSGSSFATAVATASHVNGGPVEVRGDIAYWPGRAMAYGDVPGLAFRP